MVFFPVRSSKDSNKNQIFVDFQKFQFILSYNLCSKGKNSGRQR